MKKWLYAASLLSLSVIIFNAQATDKIAVVNISSIFQQLPQNAIIAKQLENEFKGRAAELQSMEHELENKMQCLQHNASSMKASERKLLEKSVIAQRETFSNKAQAFEHDNHIRQTEERNKILSLIQEAVKNIATKKGYDVVIDTNAVAYATNTKDITTEVLNQVR